MSTRDNSGVGANTMRNRNSLRLRFGCVQKLEGISNVLLLTQRCWYPETESKAYAATSMDSCELRSGSWEMQCRWCTHANAS